METEFSPELLLSVLRDPVIAGALALTLRTCLVAAAGFLIAGPALAWLFARKRGWAVRALNFLVTLPLVFPPIALGYLLLLLLGRTGPVGALLADAGLPMIFTPAAVYFAALVAGLPLVVRPVVAALESPALRDLEFAAAVHGAGPLTIFFRVTLPLIRTHILSGLLLGLTRASGEVGITMMLGGNLSGRTNTLSLEIFNAVSRADFDAATALCLVLSAFTLLVFVLLEALRRRSVAL